MKVTYDPTYNIAYIQLSDKREEGEVRSFAISDAVNIDVTPDGSLYGIELLNANQQLGTDERMLSFSNVAKHTEQILELDID